jgi:hypothetical protein
MNALSRMFTLASLFLLSACSHTYVDTYQHGVTSNRQKVTSLQIGMPRSDVEKLMGSGDIVAHNRVRLTNPWRVEKLRTDNGKTIEILYYVTDGNTWGPWEEKQLLTPVILENERVVGWGWAFLEKAPRYVSGAPEPLKP